MIPQGMVCNCLIPEMNNIPYHNHDIDWLLYHFDIVHLDIMYNSQHHLLKMNQQNIECILLHSLDCMFLLYKSHTHQILPMRHIQQNMADAQYLCVYGISMCQCMAPSIVCENIYSK